MIRLRPRSPAICISDEIEIVVLSISGRQVRLGIIASDKIQVRLAENPARDGSGTPLPHATRNDAELHEERNLE